MYLVKWKNLTADLWEDELFIKKHPQVIKE